MAIMPLEIIPVGANGEKAAPLAAPTIRSVIQKADRPIRPASAIPTGASKAVDAILPGPMVVMNVTRIKKIIGINATLPLARRTQ